jgi:flagellar basal-body rod protein FlgC
MRVMSSIILFIIISILAMEKSFALEDSFQKAVEIAAHGSKFQAERLKIAAENMANADTTSIKPGGDPYKRKIMFASNDYDKKVRANLVKAKKIDVDKSDFILKYDPRHPAADEEGYVKYPNIQMEIERADSKEAQRSYEANINIMDISNSLMQKTIEAIK